jgi:hypothetical protein
MMSNLSVDYQSVQQTCACCNKTFRVVRGNIYTADMPVGIFLAGLHGCRARLTFLAVALRDDMYTSPQTLCVTMKVWDTATEVKLVLTDPADSPWRTEAYLGPMLTREQALAHPLLETFFAIADQILALEPVNDYFNGEEEHKSNPPENCQDVVEADLAAAYQQMAENENREMEALEWAEAMLEDVSDEA